MIKYDEHSLKDKFTSLRLLIVLLFGRIKTSLKSNLTSLSMRGILFNFYLKNNKINWKKTEKYTVFLRVYLNCTQ